MTIIAMIAFRSIHRKIVFMQNARKLQISTKINTSRERKEKIFYAAPNQHNSFSDILLGWIMP